MSIESRDVHSHCDEECGSGELSKKLSWKDTVSEVLGAVERNAQGRARLNE